MTNAQRIRAMTDAQLAKLFAEFDTGQFCNSLKTCIDECNAGREIPLARCQGCALAWLREEYKDGRSELR